MNKFYMLVGLPGSGKSTISNELNGEVFSSDALRKELWGDENTQGDNTLLFNELHKRIEKGLKELKATRSQVDVKILEEKKKSFFSILDPHVVKVELTIREDSIPEKKEKNIEKK